MGNHSSSSDTDTDDKPKVLTQVDRCPESSIGSFLFYAKTAFPARAKFYKCRLSTSQASIDKEAELEAKHPGTDVWGLLDDVVCHTETVRVTVPRGTLFHQELKRTIIDWPTLCKPIPAVEGSYPKTNRFIVTDLPISKFDKGYKVRWYYGTPFGGTPLDRRVHGTQFGAQFDRRIRGIPLYTTLDRRVYATDKEMEVLETDAIEIHPDK